MLSLLPTFEDLSAEQDAIYDLPLDASSLVTGPPGTGKTVLAIYRARRLAHTDQGFRLLTFSKPLKQYVNASAESVGVDGVVETFHRFTYGWWRSRGVGGEPPKLSRWDYDFMGMLSSLESTPATASFRHMIVDEGQDLPPAFWLLRRWMASSITVFADENQRISDHNSTLNEIRANAGITPDAHHRLTRNYRNTEQIHDVASHFVTLDDSAEAPTAQGDIPELLRFENDRDEAEFIVRAARNHPDWQVGVLAPSERARRRLTNQLEMRAGDVEVQTYNAKLGQMGIELDWSTPGIFVLNYESAKGLQFEHVFLPRLEMSNKDPSKETTRMLMYVMCTRARHALSVSWNGPGDQDPPEIAALFPWSLMDVDVEGD